MCGIFGALSRSAAGIDPQEFDCIQDLALLNYFRGVHSCGGLSVKVNDTSDEVTPTVKKYPKSVLWALESESFRQDLGPSKFSYDREKKKRVVPDDKLRLVVGHTRQATIGNVTEGNSHPFTSKTGRIVGFHNGTIVAKFRLSDEYETDSEALINLIEDHLLDEKNSDGEILFAINHALSEIYDTQTVTDVAAALVIFDTKTNKVAFFRNSKRPLHFKPLGTKAKNKSTTFDLYWTSSYRDLYYFSQSSSMYIGMNTTKDYLSDRGFQFNRVVTKVGLQNDPVGFTIDPGVGVEFDVMDFTNEIYFMDVSKKFAKYDSEIESRKKSTMYHFDTSGDPKKQQTAMYN